MSLAFGQGFTVKGTVKDSETGSPVPFASVYLKSSVHSAYTDTSGNFLFTNVQAGNYVLHANSFGFGETTLDIVVHDNKVLVIELKPSVAKLDEVVISSGEVNSFGIKRLKEVEGTTINAGKKNEVIEMDEMTANTATNNARQIYSKIPGLNIWENDGAGIQLGIGGRGLNPNRTSNFNTRQNGYDISADPLGYPESYYTPPTEAVDRIEIIRGAGALQYGPQFGGFINFKLKKGPEDKPFELTSRLTGGSFGLLNIFNCLGGTKGKVSYYTFYQYKRGNGWRENSGFYMHNAFASLTYNFSPEFSVTGEYTFMNYLAQQPGGLTDAMFERDPRQSLRKRNWFKVKWNLAALIFDYKFSSRLKLNSRFFGLIAERDALGLLGRPDRADDPSENRDLWVDKFRNFGNETRLLYMYNLNKNLSAFVVGFRYYNGNTNRQQGLGNNRSTGNKSDFEFENPDAVEYSKYIFPSNNIALFVENIFKITSQFSITPGIRFEWIKTDADGFYNLINRDGAGNILINQRIDENLSNSRSFVIAGIGASYKLNDHSEVYGNISQNYRSINFNDMRVVNPNYQVDKNLQDERGYTADIGFRGNVNKILNYDFSVFTINYDNRIGRTSKYDSSTYNYYLLRTNISQSRNLGFEAFAELDFWKLLKGPEVKSGLSLFGNFSVIDARYVNSKENAYENKFVELVPGVLVKTGITYKRKNLSVTYQFSYTGRQYTDATNSEKVSSGIFGVIPSYYVMDLSCKYTYKRYQVSATVNNLTNNYYFTRRAEGYPGPGIIPSDGLGFYLTLQVKFN